MTAGTGVRHSEYNASNTAPVHFLQIWIIPEEDGLKPGYEQKTFLPEEMRGKLRLIGSRDGRDGSVTIHQDVDLFASRLGRGETVSLKLSRGRGAWVQVVEGELTANGERLGAGDGIAVEDADVLRLEGRDDVHALVFDMAL
jgi:quercetin 2,3-dioxygenase